MNPINLILRFLLEVFVLIIAAIYGASLAEGFLGILTSCSLLILITALWVTFNVPGDPSRSGKAPVKVPGWFRLLLELSIFGFGAFFAQQLGYRNEAFVFIGLVLIHNLLAYKRNIWLLKQ